jgi:hypothetical protein
MYLVARALANDLYGYSNVCSSIVVTKRLRRRRDCLAVSSIPHTLGGGGGILVRLSGRRTMIGVLGRREEKEEAPAG